MAVAKVKGEFPIYYEESGAGARAVVVVGVADEFGARLAERLAGQDARVIRYDPRGIGQTPERQPDTMSQHSADLAAVTRALKVLKPVIVGSGDLAAIAVNFAVRHLREIRRVVLVAPDLAPAEETKLGKVGEKAVVLREADVERVAQIVLAP